MATICFYARFENTTGDGVNGLTPTWDVERVTRSDGTRVALVTADATNIIVGRRGLYGYRLTGADLTLYDYVATAITASAVPTVHEVAALWTLWSLSWGDILSAAWTTANSIGKRIVDFLDAAVSSRATQADILSDATPFLGANVDMAISDVPTLAEFFTVNTGQTAATAIDGSVVGEVLNGVNTVAFPAGGITYTYTLTSAATGLPITGAEIWFTTDIAGTNVVWKGNTDTFGIARDVNNNLPQLDTGTYYIWCLHPDFVFNQPNDTEIVS